MSPRQTSRAPKCRNCGSTDIEATSSQQMRRIRGKKRLVADVVCMTCEHSWWSVNKIALRMAREADAEREALVNLP